MYRKGHECVQHGSHISTRVKILQSDTLPNLFNETAIEVNSMAHDRRGSNFKGIISDHMLRTKFISTCEISLR